MNTVIWKSVPGFAGYEVSNTGLVRSYKKRFTTKIYEEANLLSPSTNHGGYKLVVLRKNDTSFGRKVHRLVLEAFVGPRPEGRECGHLNGDPADNRLENLAWITPKENGEHRVLHGTSKNCGTRGSANHLSKLIEAEVLDIKERLIAGESYADIAVDYPVEYFAILAIAAGRSWTHTGPDMSEYYTPVLRLTDDQALEAVASVREGEPIKSIAARLNVDASSVARTFKRHTGIGVRAYKKTQRGALIAA